MARKGPEMYLNYLKQWKRSEAGTKKVEASTCLDLTSPVTQIQLQSY